VKLHPSKNLIVGMNHTGKSSLIKSIFFALGARPQGDLADWDKNTISMVEFSVDGKRYRALQQNAYRALFSASGEMIEATGNQKNWTAAFARVTGFNLVLTDKNRETVVGDARCFFLQFYINQDGSWLSTWNTFVGLQQYQAPVQAILEYFTGVKPPEYYEINSQKAHAQRTLDDLRVEQRMTSQVRERFGQSVPLAGPKVVPENFEQDVERLTEEVSALNAQQEHYRDIAVREQEVLDSIRLQVKLALATLSVYDSDSSFLRVEAHATLACPTCGAEHEKPFLEMLTYAEDARVLRELVVRLQTDAGKAADQHNKTKRRLGELESQYQRVSEVLNTRRGELEFGEVVRGIGAEAAFEAFETELRSLKAQIDQRLSEIDGFTSRLQELTSARRSKEILELFRDSYASAVISLNMPAVNAKGTRLTSRPDVSGSGGPRSLLAYYAALWRTSLGIHGSFSIPLVIDAPQQQGQDEKNLPKIIQFIANDLPKDAQIVLGIETKTEEHFDNVIELNDPYHLLQPDEYGAVQQLVDPFLKSMYAALFTENQANESDHNSA
jgi:hypothetical protein